MCNKTCHHIIIPLRLMVAVLSSPKMLPQMLVRTLKLHVIPSVDGVKLLQFTLVGAMESQLPQLVDVKLY